MYYVVTLFAGLLWPKRQQRIFDKLPLFTTHGGEKVATSLHIVLFQAERQAGETIKTIFMGFGLS